MRFISKKERKQMNRQVIKIKGIFFKPNFDKNYDEDKDTAWKIFGSYFMEGAEIAEMAPFIDSYRPEDVRVLVTVAIRANIKRMLVPTIGIPLKVQCDIFYGERKYRRTRSF